MFRRAVVALVVGALAAPTGSAADPVPVRGSQVTYSPSVEVQGKDRNVKLSLTGVGLRTRIGLRVYAVASYIQDGAAVRTAEDVVKADAVRLLHLVMERTVEPAEFLGAFKDAVGKTYPADKFAAEFKQLAEAVGDTAAAKGDHVTMLYVPGAGVRIRLADKVDVTVKGADFARALWEVYLGPKPIDESLKKGLVGMLPPP
jgi:hypothetical protein